MTRRRPLGLLAAATLVALASACAAGGRSDPAARLAPEEGRASAATSPAAERLRSMAPRSIAEAPRPTPEREPPAWRPPSFGTPAPPADGARRLGATPPDRGLRAKVVTAARAHLGRPFRGDCSAYVVRAMRDAGLSVRLPAARTGSEALYLAGRKVRSPRPGDLAFFHDTYDRNRDRKLNDRFTHVALVEEVDGSSVVLLHRGSRGVRRVRMDLSRPADPAANDAVRVRRRGDGRGTRYLTGQLFAAFGELLPGDGTQMLQASRGSGTGARHPASR